LISAKTALGTEPVTSSYLNWHLRRYGVTVERIRRDRVLHEALTAGPDPLHLTPVFNLSYTTASRYAAIAQDLLDDQIEQATGQRPAQPRCPSDEPTDIPGLCRMPARGKCPQALRNTSAV
jgi:hypothetical protein